ncbi:class I SAM-dependent methyltransferase [Micromonospora maritima]|uniref:Class I SAM-dependent methyltransferase n=1 Tax=Micromonospora maritima TaxID=986711 RepID=A0ABW7ZMS4_9ACTN
MSERALSFGVAAQAYERFRPGYPPEVADLVLAYADRPLRTALEIGAGTGKATRLFARSGLRVTATDPDAAMLAELRAHVSADVRTVRAAFEELPTDETYDLVYAAAALHWTRPEGRWDRVVALLTPGGVFASFGGPLRLRDPAVEEAVRRARAPFLDSDEIPSPDGTPETHAMRWPGTELRRDARFTDVRQSEIERRVTMGRGRLGRSAVDRLGLPRTAGRSTGAGPPADPGGAARRGGGHRRRHHSPRPAAADPAPARNLTSDASNLGCGRPPRRRGCPACRCTRDSSPSPPPPCVNWSTRSSPPGATCPCTR